MFQFNLIPFDMADLRGCYFSYFGLAAFEVDYWRKSMTDTRELLKRASGEAAAVREEAWKDPI